MKDLEITEFGNSVLRETTRRLNTKEIESAKVQKLISSMYDTLTSKKLGIGLAAPQVGESVALAVVKIQETSLRSDVQELSLTMINPKIIEVFGRKSQMWEGCISLGANGKAALFAKVPRYNKIKLWYVDEYAKRQSKIFEGLVAHVIQHEVDHLNGILFVDNIKDTTTIMTYTEYKKMKHKKEK